MLASPNYYEAKCAPLIDIGFDFSQQLHWYSSTDRGLEEILMYDTAQRNETPRCPLCGGTLTEIHGQQRCTQCNMMIDGCCEGGWLPRSHITTPSHAPEDDNASDQYSNIAATTESPGKSLVSTVKTVPPCDAVSMAATSGRSLFPGWRVRWSCDEPILV